MPCTRRANTKATQMTCTFQDFSLFATGIVSPRVSLFRKPNPTCTAKDDDDDNDGLVTGLVITLAVLAVGLLLVASVTVHLIRMVRPFRTPTPAPTPTPVPAHVLARALARTRP